MKYLYFWGSIKKYYS